ncbi:MAG TPA: hypothetical protein VHK69_01795 [Chitinophagaceae bacterium]|nr:hypothetical protein [Chitinophagaceae bacterium]
MPNKANQSNNGSNANKGHSKGISTGASEQKPNPERSDLKRQGDHDKGGSTDRTSNQGRKAASGGSAED